jgi:hypothetical protein
MAFSRFTNMIIALRAIVSSVGSFFYVLVGFLRKILSLLAGKSESFVKSSGHFIQLLKSVNFQSLGNFVIFNIVSFFTNAPDDETRQVTRKKLHNS